MRTQRLEIALVDSNPGADSAQSRGAGSPGGWASLLLWAAGLGRLLVSDLWTLQEAQIDFFAAVEPYHTAHI